MRTSAKLHNTGTVRFQNLPSGAGRLLVIDSVGNVCVSSQSARIATQDVAAAEQSEQISALNAKIEKLEKALEMLQKQQQVASSYLTNIDELILPVCWVSLLMAVGWSGTIMEQGCMMRR